MAYMINRQARLLFLVTAALWGASPILIGIATVLGQNTLPLRWAPELAALPGLFLLERILGFAVPTHETHWTMIQIMARAAIFLIVNVVFWLGLAQAIIVITARFRTASAHGQLGV